MKKRKIYSPNLLGLWELECDDERSYTDKGLLVVEKRKNKKTGKTYYEVSLGNVKNTNKEFAEKVISICKKVDFEIVIDKNRFLGDKDER